MATRPPLNPKSTQSATILPSSGSTTNVAAACPIGVYTGSAGFLQGARDQVSYVYKKLGGDILDIEITEGNVYAAYEESVLEYSYIVNIHQSKNVLSDALGDATGSFNSDGELISSGSYNQHSGLSASLEGDRVELKYPNFQFSYARRVGQALSNEVNVGGFDTVYSASIAITASIQDYDLQAIVYSASVDSENDYKFSDKVGKNKILIRKVYYKTPAASWRFYGYYGGLNTVGNLQSYGQYADDSQFQIVPVWQNKQQALGYEDALYTRNSHYSYEIKNNQLRIFPNPTSATSPTKYWIEFIIPNEHNSWDQNNQRRNNTHGINNMNTLPFANIPYDKINSIGKQWIRRFGLSLSKEILGHVRSKFATIPIPGESVTLNGDALVSQAKEEQTALREELKTVLDEMTYDKLVEKDAGIVANVGTMQEKLPMGIFTG